MAINIKTIAVKNFMSIGNVMQAIDFEREKLTLVLGENLDMCDESGNCRNGVGKSVIINAISYALYGNALTNIKKDNLINKINNKNMLVSLTFNKDGVDYKIERGRKPNVLKFFINNKEQEVDDSQGDSRETQKDLSGLLEMSHDMFKHIVALNTYTEPFLSMKAGDQRTIIEQLLGITLLSEKAEALKVHIKATKDKIFQETTEIEAAKKSNEKIKQSISSLETRKSTWATQKINDVTMLKDSIIELENLSIEAELASHEQNKIYNEQYAKLTSLTKEKKTLETALIQAEKNVAKYQRELDILGNHKCHACNQDLQTDKHTEMTKVTKTQLDEAYAYLEKIATNFTNITQEIEGIGTLGTRPVTFYSTLEQALTHQSNLTILKSQLQSREVEIDPYQEQIDELNNTAIQEICWDRVNDLSLERDHQEFLLKLLTSKDSFIRKKIIDQNLAYLNSRLTFYLEKMGLPHTVVFQNDLSVEITQLGQNLDFDNLSRGERNRLILGLSWAFRDVWESLYQNINLLFVDELIDNGLDTSGVECALGVLKLLARERNKHIFLISHKDELIGRVNNVLKVVKENGFTYYNTDFDNDNNNCNEVTE